MTEPKYLGEILEPLNFFDNDLVKREKHIENLLCRYLNMKTVIAFIGAGASMPLGYPSWGGFAKDIYTLLRIFLEESDSENYLIELTTPDKQVAKKISGILFKKKEHKKCLKRIFIERQILETYLRLLRNFIKPNYNTEKSIKELQRLYKENKKDFEEFLGYIENPKNNELDALTVFSEFERLLCMKEEWLENKQSKFFRAIVKSYFQIKRITANFTENITQEKKNPYLALLKLPIKKYVTFNYDLEIERALLYRNRIPRNDLKEKSIYGKDIHGKYITCEQIIRECGQKSFSQKSDYCDEMAKFSIARYEGTQNTVFHCHGRIDDTDSCIISEEDYQSWYLREENEKFAPFRQTLDIILDSNPILFIGFGLKDADLMRVLRSITANRSVEKNRNPLFCLLYIGKEDINKNPSRKVTGKNYKWNSEEELRNDCKALYLKYGLHVIPVEEEKYKKTDTTEEALCNKLIELHGRWREWWEGILTKPMFKRFSIDVNKESYFHYEFKTENLVQHFDENLHEKLDYALGFKKEIIPKSKNRKKTEKKGGNEKEEVFAPFLAVVTGYGGTGKSWSVQRYLKEKIKDGYRTFYWSSYYGNDVLTGIDRLISFFKTHEDLEQNSEKNKFDWLMDILNGETKVVIVFDGIEKLLRANNENTEGESVSPEVKEFFKIISNGNVKSKIIITSRLFPTDILLNLQEKIIAETESEEKKRLLDIKSYIKERKFLSAPRCWSKYLLKSVRTTDDESENEKTLSSICSLLDGHIFGISLMKEIIKDINARNEGDLKIKSVVRDIANTPIEKRIDRVIKEAIDNADKINFKEQKQIAKEFIQRIALFMHPVRAEVAEVCLIQFTDASNELEIGKLLENLVEKNLVQKVNIKGQPSYVVHPLVKSYVFERIHESRFSSFPSLQLPGYTSGREVVDPGSKAGKIVAENLFNALCLEAENTDKKETASDMCRAAFSILRSRFCSNTVPRWGNYTDYTKMTLRLYDTAKKVSSPAHWKYYEPSPQGLLNCSKDGAPLYPDELAWVYNEVGLASMSMGNNLNATALWEQGYEISKLIDMDRDGRYLFQSNINMGAIYIHYGKLNIARDYLDKAFEIANKLENKNLSNRVAGYIALVKYLRGNLEEAHHNFEEACSGLLQNPRARAVFMNYHGELLIKLNKVHEALEKIEQSRHLAESEYYPDLIAYARLSKANVFSKQGEHIKAQNEYQFVLKVAKEKHLRRLEAATLSGMSRLSEKLGDFSTAIRLAVDSLKISNEYLLSLHQTQGLIVLGKALLSGHHEKLGLACLKTARELAQKQEYFLRMNEAQEELLKYNVTY